MTTDDFSGFRRRYDNALERLSNADIHPDDHDAIRAWLRRRDGDLAASSLAQYTNRLRVLAERSDVPLVELSIEDVRDLFFELRRDDTMGRSGPPSDTTVYNYQAALSTWATDRDADWVDEFDPDKPDSGGAVPHVRRVRPGPGGRRRALAAVVQTDPPKSRRARRRRQASESPQLQALGDHADVARRVR
jgi:hypothetical protein